MTRTEEKKCTRCGEIKPRTEFYKNRRCVSDGLQAQCKACRLESAQVHKEETASQRRKYYQAHKEEHAIHGREYYLANKERIAIQQREYYLAHKERIAIRVRAWALANKERIAIQQRKWRLANKEKISIDGQKKWLANKEELNYQRRRKKYRLEAGEYERRLAEQDGVCAICKKPETTKYHGVTRPLSVDHDHQTGEVRGLLCGKCNTGSGQFNDDAALMYAAGDYNLKFKGKVKCSQPQHTAV